MKIASWMGEHGSESGFLIDNRAIAFKRAFDAAGLADAPTTTLALLERNDWQSDLQKAFAAANDLPLEPAIEPANWLAPVRGYKIVSCAINNAGVAKLGLGLVRATR